MKCMNVIFLLLVSNVIVAMEPERKQLMWRLDRKIESGKQAGFCDAWFNKQGTKIMSELSDEDDDRVYVWNRLDGTRIGKRFVGIFEDERLADEYLSEDSCEEGFTRVQNGQVTHTTSGIEEVSWLNKLYKQQRGRPEISECKNFMAIYFTYESTAHVWDRQANKELSQLVHHSNIKALRLCKSEKIITFADDGVLRVWDVTRGTELFMVDKPVKFLKLCESEKIITTSDDYIVRVLNINTGNELFSIPFDQAVISAGFNTSETEMVVVTKDGKIQILVQEEIK